MIDTTPFATGTLTINVYDKDHNLKDHVETHNMVVNTGYYILADLLAGVISNNTGNTGTVPDAVVSIFKNPISSMAIGTLKESATAAHSGGATAPIWSEYSAAGADTIVKAEQTNLAYEIDRGVVGALSGNSLIVAHEYQSNTIAFRGIFLPSSNDAKCGYICEAGLFRDAITTRPSSYSGYTNMFSRAIFRPVYKDTTDTFEITWVIKIGSLENNVTNTVTFTDTQTITTNFYSASAGGGVATSSDTTVSTGTSTNVVNAGS